MSTQCANTSVPWPTKVLLAQKTPPASPKPVSSITVVHFIPSNHFGTRWKSWVFCINDLQAGPSIRMAFFAPTLPDTAPSTKCLPNVYQKNRQSPGAQGVGGFPFFRASTGCLPVLLFYAKRRCLEGFRRLSATFSPPVRGVTRAWQVEKVEKPRKIWLKRRKLFRKS